MAADTIDGLIAMADYLLYRARRAAGAERALVWTIATSQEPGSGRAPPQCQ